MNIFCLENPHASHNAVNGSTGWTETFLNAEDATLDTAPPAPRLPSINKHALNAHLDTFSYRLRLAAPTCWETC